jgi:hypothetical protein
MRSIAPAKELILTMRVAASLSKIAKQNCYPTKIEDGFDRAICTAVLEGRCTLRRLSSQVLRFSHQSRQYVCIAGLQGRAVFGVDCSSSDYDVSGAQYQETPLSIHGSTVSTVFGKSESQTAIDKAFQSVNAFTNSGQIIRPYFDRAGGSTQPSLQQSGFDLWDQARRDLRAALCYNCRYSAVSEGLRKMGLPQEETHRQLYRLSLW